MPLRRAEEEIKRVYTDPDRLADELAERIEVSLGRRRPIQKIRNSHFLSGFIGASGLALFLVGIERVFGFLPGSLSILFGLAMMAISGVLLKRLG